jgi:hypothetical protein
VQWWFPLLIRVTCCALAVAGPALDRIASCWWLSFYAARGTQLSSPPSTASHGKQSQHAPLDRCAARYGFGSAWHACCVNRC